MARNLAHAYGGYDVLSAVTGLRPDTLRRSHKFGSYAVAVLLARAAGIPVEQLLAGKPVPVGACALCGRKGGA